MPKKKKSPGRRLLGVYPMGFEYVDVYVDYHDSGGWFDLNPSPKAHGTITIGFLGYRRYVWRDVIGIFLHETAEYLHARLRTRFYPSEESARSAGGYIFVADHAQFTELCGRQAEIVTAALPDLSRAFRKYQKWEKKNQ